MASSDHDDERHDPRHEIDRLRRELDEARQENERLTRTVAEHELGSLVTRTVMDLADAALFAKDIDGRYVYCNPRGAEIVGLTVDDVVGHTDQELYSPEQAAAFQDHTDEVMRTRGAVHRLNPIPLPSGTQYWQSQLVPLMTPDGRIVGVAGIATDITEREQAERQLRRRTRQLETAQRIARLGTWTWDAVTGRIELSDELTRILGGAPSQAWTIDHLEAITLPDDLAEAIAAVQSARRGNDVSHLFRIALPDGSIRWLRMRSEATMASADDGDRLVIGTIQDVTEREEAERRRIDLERRLQQTQRLETLGQLAGGVAHDFNNLLAVIGMQAELATQSLHDDPADAAAQLHDLLETVERAGALTSQLLVFSRHEGYDDTVIDLRASLDALGPLLARSLGTHIALDIDLDPHLAAVEADRSQIEQVLVNLAMNARDAMPEGGTLRIEGTNVISEGVRSVRLVVSDTGHGMPADHVDRAFEPFFTTKPAGVGTGLGLPTVHGIVTRSGGTVELRSEPGSGTTIEIRLPASSEAPSAIDPETPPPLTANDSLTVLIVEDLVPLGQLAGSVLRRAGYRAIVATRGAEALEIVDSGEHVDLVLTDVVMPEMSGRQLADHLRIRRPDLPVVFMSGYTGGMLEVGDHDDDVIITKPFTAAELTSVISSRLAQRG